MPAAPPTTGSLNDLKRMSNPPIVEVVCGVVFAPQPNIDAVSLGGFWLEHERRYPKREIHHAVFDDAPGVSFTPGMPPSRVWLVSEDEEFIIQAQFDRFFFNWRKRAGKYPRFNDRDGNRGVLSLALEEFGVFKRYCETKLHGKIVPRLAVLTKVDVFVEGEHWRDTADLGVMLPWLSNVLSFPNSHLPLPSLRLKDRRPDGGIFRVELATTMAHGPNGPVRLVKLETRVDRTLGAGDNALRVAFEEENDELNHVLAMMIPEAERKARFKEGEEEHVA